MGTDEVLPKLDRDDYQILKAKKKCITADAQIASAGGIPLDTNVLETNIIYFKLDVEEWKDNNKKVCNVITLLPKWVDPSIRGKV